MNAQKLPKATFAAVALFLLGKSALCAADAKIYRSFEMRAVNSDSKANGETDFKGKTETMSTEERIAFLNAYTDFASAWFGVPKLDQKAVPDGQAAKRLAQLKPQPLPTVRTVLNLNDGWKQAASTTPEEAKRARPWRDISGAVLQNGELLLPAGDHDLLDLAQSTGWRYEIRWEIRRVGSPVYYPILVSSVASAHIRWMFGGNMAPDTTALNDYAIHQFRLQVDLENGHAYLSDNDRRVWDFPIQKPAAGKAAMLRIVSDGSVALSGLTFLDYMDRRKLVAGLVAVLPGGNANQDKKDKQPYEPIVIADDNFRAPADLKNWQSPSYDDSSWKPAELPCAHGGFREKGEDLYLRRTFELPEGKIFRLEVEALDPSGEIYLNGKLVAKIPDRLPILLDVTKFVKQGANVLAFKVNPNWVEDLVSHSMLDRSTGWFAGRVKLHAIRGDAAIDEMLVNTVSLAAAAQGGDAEQTHRMALSNAGDAPFDGTLEIEYRPWFPADGATAATAKFPVKIAAHDSLKQTVNVKIPRAMPWSAKAPFLYKVTATLRDNAGTAVDDATDTTGVRTVAQKDGQLLLNGKPALLIGAQNMGMRPYPFIENAAKYNRCATPEMLMTEFLGLKNANNNLLRVHIHTSMNKQGSVNDPRIAEMADQLGVVLFWSSPSWRREGDEHSIDTKNIGAYMRQVFNHPSIINWELGNHPNAFNNKKSPVSRTDEFVRRVVDAVSAVDTSRLITPTTYWSWTHYGNDMGTLDSRKNPITAVPEYTNPLVTRGSQDALTGYGAQWSGLREWPSGRAKDTLSNGIRAWFNFEHEESTAQPNWNLCGGYPWYRVRSYEINYDTGSIGRILKTDEWRASQGWQAFSCYESMRKQIFHGVAGFSWCTLEGGANGGTYEKPLLDPAGNAKLSWYVRKMLCAPVIAGSDNVDTVYGPTDTITPCVLNVGPARTVDLTVVVKDTAGNVFDTRDFKNLRLSEGRTLLKLAPFKPKLPPAGYCIVEYTTTER